LQHNIGKNTIRTAAAGHQSNGLHGTSQMNCIKKQLSYSFTKEYNLKTCHLFSLANKYADIKISAHVNHKAKQLKRSKLRLLLL